MNPTLPAELTIHQAADVLNVTRAHVKNLLAQGQIDHQGEGARLRIERDALLAYKAREAQEQGHGY